MFSKAVSFVGFSTERPSLVSYLSINKSCPTKVSMIKRQSANLDLGIVVFVTNKGAGLQSYTTFVTREAQPEPAASASRTRVSQ
jgi:hypothetical protein